MADNTSVQVRPLVASDRGRWGELWTGYLTYYETTLPPEVYWLTQDFNHTARQLYDRIGTKSPFIKYTRS